MRAGATRAAAMLLALSAMPAGAAEVVVRPDISLTDDGTLTGAASVAAGDVLVVVLPAQPGTGYAWEARPTDAARLAPVEVACPERRADGPVGVAEPACFAWRVLSEGRATVTLVYRRHWETDPEGVLRYDLAVAVTPSG